MSTHAIGNQTCPSCGSVNDYATNATSVDADSRHAAPTEGDVSICATCAAVCLFTADLSYRALSEEEISTLGDATQQDFIRRARQAIRARRATLN